MKKLIELIEQLDEVKDGEAFSDAVFDLVEDVAGDHFVPAEGRAITVAQMLGSVHPATMAQIGIAMGVRALHLLQEAKKNPEVKREADIRRNTVPSVH